MTEELYNRLKTSPVLFEKELGLVQLTGPDRVSWLQGMVTNDVERLKPGQGCYAAHLSPQGKVVSQMLVLAEEDSLYLELERDNAANSAAELDKLLIMEDATIEDCSSRIAGLSLGGAGARGLLEECLGETLHIDAFYDHSMIGTVRVIRADLGYDLIASENDAAELARRLVQAGAELGDSALWNLLRIEAGIPMYGVDVDRTTTFPELGEKGIDYDKGCYIGQEVVAKIRYIGHVNRRFVGLKLHGTDFPEPGSPVRRDSRDVGRVTSAVYSPVMQSGIALGFVKRGSEEAGTEVEVVSDNQPQPATITSLPFISHSNY